MTINLKITSFTDYRTFLIAYAQERKRLKISWSYSVWAKTLGLKDKSSIGKIIQGTRNPGKNLVKKLIQYFKFSPSEAQYFNDLISFKKLKKDPRLSLLLLEKIGKNHPNEAIKMIEYRNFEIISNWYCLVIREMVNLENFVSDPKWIAKKLYFQVPLKDIKYGLDLLINSGLLTRKPNGDLKIVDGRVRTHDDVSSKAIKKYHESMIDKAKLALREIPMEQREFHASTLTMNFENIPQAKEFIRKIKRKFCKIFEEKNGNGTFQIQIQFFPFTKK